MKWQLLYRMSKNGTSMITFMKNIDRYDVTVIVIEDSKGFKFGSFTVEEWTPSKNFYGGPDSFVYTFA